MIALPFEPLRQARIVTERAMGEVMPQHGAAIGGEAIFDAGGARDPRPPGLLWERQWRVGTREAMQREGHRLDRGGRGLGLGLAGMGIGLRRHQIADAGAGGGLVAPVDRYE